MNELELKIALLVLLGDGEWIELEIDKVEWEAPKYFCGDNRQN